MDPFEVKAIPQALPSGSVVVLGNHGFVVLSQPVPGPEDGRPPVRRIPARMIPEALRDELGAGLGVSFPHKGVLHVRSLSLAEEVRLREIASEAERAEVPEPPPPPKPPFE